MLKRLLPIIVLALAVVLPLGGIIVLGQLASQDLRSHDRFRTRFADVSCVAPPGLTRAEFLDEVQYLSGVPAELHLLDDDLGRRLETAFAAHPWVEKVDAVEVRAPSVYVRLSFRRPVLAVRWNSEVRVVDRHGILLPAGADTSGLPIFAGDAAPPKGVAGTLWGDPSVTEAAAKAGSR